MRKRNYLPFICALLGSFAISFGTQASETVLAGLPVMGENAEAQGNGGKQESVPMTGTENNGSLGAGSQDAENSKNPELLPESEAVAWNPDWEYAEYSKINTGEAVLYYCRQPNRRNVVVALNAGHGTEGGSDVQTQCHPDGTAKVTGGSTAEGSVTATAVSTGTTFLNGTPEAEITLKLAQVVKVDLLANGYDVLMLRDGEDVQLDNIARTVIANNNADCHIALHFDSTENDKGAYYIAVPKVPSYLAMEPVASHYEQHDKLGNSLADGMRMWGVKMWDGYLETDLTQTSYSTIPSVDLEVGDRGTDYSDAFLMQVAEGIRIGLDSFFFVEV